MNTAGSRPRPASAALELIRLMPELSEAPSEAEAIALFVAAIGRIWPGRAAGFRVSLPEGEDSLSIEGAQLLPKADRELIEGAVDMLRLVLKCRREREYRLANARFRRMIDSNIVGVAIATADGRIVEANDYFLRIVGFTRAEFESGIVDWRTITPPEWLPADEAAIGELRKRGTCAPYEKEYARRDGSRAAVQIVDALLPGPEEQIAAFVLDVTARRRSEESLREAQKMAHLGFWRWEVSTGAVEWSEEVYRIFRLDPGSFVPRIESIMALSPLEDDNQRDRELIRRATESREAGSYEQRFLRPDGGVGYYSSTFHGEYDGSGGLARIIGTVQDITERKEAEEATRLRERRDAEGLERLVRERTAQLVAANAELEAFAYSVSHDLRAPLRAIDGYTSILVEGYEPLLDAEGRRICAVIVESARRMGALIEKLLSFSRVGRSGMEPVAVDMGELATKVFLQLTNTKARERISLRIAKLPAAFGDPGLLRQLWANLLSNALKFTSKNPRAVIEVEGETSESELVYSVKDDGAGFDPRYADKLFKVFQRLHRVEDFEGTGVGLAIAHRIVALHAGRIWAEGSVGGGATFSFTLRKDA